MPGSTPELKKIAFVAMPFGIKTTGLEPDQGPEKVDFDALWQKGIKPALESLNYLPVRADEQSGSVIIKDMLEQLVYADLVIADISIPNGNVFYEAGVRHASKRDGCVLIAAEWVQPLFDLEQITSIRYPFPKSAPTGQHYNDVAQTLTDAIPGLVDADGPVYELTGLSFEGREKTKILRESLKGHFNFNVKLRQAVLQAEHGDNKHLRDLASHENLADLPDYALKDLVMAVRDWLNWHEVNSLIERLPDSLQHDAFYLELNALATVKSGTLEDKINGIGLLEQVIERDGKTPDRLGSLGSRYRSLASLSPRNTKRKYLDKAILKYRDGMELDLNGYYCSHKLMLTLLQRGLSKDKKEARSCAEHTERACRRAELLGSNDEWLQPTQLIMAFYYEDTRLANDLMEQMLASDWANWKRIGLLSDLKSLLGLQIDSELTAEEEDEKKQELIDLCRDLQSFLPVSQNRLLSRFKPRLEQDGSEFKKSQGVKARLAIEGETIISVTDAGEETSNRAGANDVVVENDTKAKEQYIVEMDIFMDRYDVDTTLSEQWQAYSPKGKILGLEVSHEVTALLDVGDQFFIEAPWKSDQYCEEGDYLVSPLPDLSEVYRIGRAEFEQTYLPDDSASSEK